MAVAPSGGGFDQIITTDLHGLCTKRHTGTSASAPLVSGMIALGLEESGRKKIILLWIINFRPISDKSKVDLERCSIYSHKDFNLQRS